MEKDRRRLAPRFRNAVQNKMPAGFFACVFFKPVSSRILASGVSPVYDFQSRLFGQILVGDRIARRQVERQIV